MLCCSRGTSLFGTCTLLFVTPHGTDVLCTKSQENINIIWRTNCVHYRYQHQFENCTYICKTCYSNGKEVVVTPKLTSSGDTSWFGLAKYAWSGYVSFIVCVCAVISREVVVWLCTSKYPVNCTLNWYIIALFIPHCFQRHYLPTYLSSILTDLCCQICYWVSLLWRNI